MTPRMEMNARVEKIRRKPKDCRHTIPVDDEPLFCLKYKGGAVVRAQFFTGAVAVIRGDAKMLNEKNVPILPTFTVICRRNCFNGALKQFRLGVPVEVIDPGSKNSFLVVLKGMESSPMIAKSMCRPVKTCTDTTQGCGNCCNHKK